MKKETRISDGEIKATIETIETVPEDGFVSDEELSPVKMQHYSKGNTQLHMGYSKTIVVTTDDPRITRPFVRIICGLFFAIGLVMLLLGGFFFGAVFVVVSVFTYIKSNKEIDKVAERLEKEGRDVTIDSPEEREQLKQEVTSFVTDSVKDVASGTFTKEHFKWFAKATIPVYCIISALIVVFIGVFVNIFLGLFLLIILGLFGWLYYFILSKICKH